MLVSVAAVISVSMGVQLPLGSFVEPVGQTFVQRSALAPLSTFRFAQIYSNSMVLQMAPQPASIWGYAEPNAPVSVALGATQVNTSASAAGKWRVSLPPQPASKVPVVITATSILAGKPAVLSLDDVLFGDVWVCSGQVCTSDPLFPQAYFIELVLTIDLFSPTVEHGVFSSHP